MLVTTSFEEITQIRMSREIGGKPVYWVAAYLVDGLLIDSGCSYTADELASFIDGREVRQVVNTHFHEDHVGGNRLLQAKFGVAIYAPKQLCRDFSMICVFCQTKNIRHLTDVFSAFSSLGD